jgi:serine/threonine protein kinase
MDWETLFVNLRKPGFVPGFEIINKLGSGVFGEVYKARKESIGRFYAIKFLKVSEDKISEAIFKELDALKHLAQLDHPNLVTIEDRGEVSGIPYIIMGYAGDETLKTRLAAGDLPTQTAVEIFRAIGAGVSALHQRSIVHFDLKPANIFLNGDHARVGDYGLSKIMNESHKTMSMGRGTPYYMAPEMLNRTGDHKSDIYSLGVMLFEMVTGSVPFQGDSDWEVLQKHEKQAVVIPVGVVPSVAAVIRRAMAKNPDDRFASIDEMLSALGDGNATGSASAGAPSGTVPPPLPDQRPPQNRVPRHIEKNIHVIGQLLAEEGGEAAEKARRAWQNRPSADGLDGDSFYTDFDRMPKPSRKERRQRKARRRQARAESRSVWQRPFRWALAAVAAVFSALFGFLGHLLSNLLRYAIVLIISAGLAVSVVYLIHGSL